MRSSPAGGGHTVDVTIAGERLNFLVDTGSDLTMIDAAVAKRLKLKAVDSDVKAVTFEGEVKRQTAYVRNASLSGTPLPPMNWDVIDLSFIRKTNKEDGHTVQDGIFGMDMMNHLSAIIDTHGRWLLLRHPFTVERGLQGAWEARPEGPDGKAGPPVRFTLDKLDAKLEVGGNTARFKAWIEQDWTGREIRLLPDPAPDVFRHCRYEFRGDRLVIAGPLLPGDDVKAVPEAVGPPKPGKPKYSVLTFERVPKPAAKPKP